MKRFWMDDMQSYMLSVVHFGEQYDPTGADGENRNERRTLVKK